MKTSITIPTSVFPRGVGYLTFMGYFQIGVGLLTVLFSALAIFQGSIIDPQLLNPMVAGEASRGFFGRMIAGYMAFQMVFGWLLGTMMIMAGVCCLQLRGRTFVTVSAVLNLLNFPHGTTAAILMLHGFRRQEVIEALDHFASESEHPDALADDPLGREEQDDREEPPVALPKDGVALDHATLADRRE